METQTTPREVRTGRLLALVEDAEVAVTKLESARELYVQARRHIMAAEAPKDMHDAVRRMNELWREEAVAMNEVRRAVNALHAEVARG
jgi:hypothetical protein